MRSKLSKEPTNKYSPMESSLFDILARHKVPMSLVALALEYYAPGSGPFNWQPIIRGALETLIRKAKLNKEPWQIEKIKKPGEKRLTYQIRGVK